MDLYKIEPLSLNEFITDAKYKLPRYQRKDTWKDDQYFGLCVSVFQGYPIGVCIINSVGNTRWLLDGRQRRTCLQSLYEDPVKLYDWAKKFCKFKATADPDEVAKSFWEKIHIYLGADTDMIPNSKDENDIADSANSEEDEALDSFSVESNGIPDYQNGNLKKLLNLICMVHQKKTNGNAWFTAFNFTKWFIPKSIRYYKDPENTDGPNKIIIPSLLTSFIRETMEEVKDEEGHFSSKRFIECIERSWIFKGEETSLGEKNKNDFEKYVNQYWKRIEASYQAISDLDDVLRSARVGMIILTEVKTFDAQNIFSRINSGGTQLKAAELLSAKPYWNSPVTLSEDARKNIRLLYKKLKIQLDSNYVRWDIPATLVSRIDNHHLFFTSNNSNDNINEVDTEEISMGFKIVSACYVGGISKISLDRLELPGTLKWDDGFEQFVRDLTLVIDLIFEAIPEIQVLNRWNIDFNTLLGFAPSVELLTVAYKRWIALEKPGYTSQTGRKFLSEFKNHLDRLIIEKASGKWKGSGDSRVAFNISSKNIIRRIDPISPEENNFWRQYISGAICGMVDGQITKLEMVKPLIYYAKIINNELPQAGDKTFDIDHIYPQALFEANGNVNGQYKESLTNLALLPSDINSAKRDRKLDDVDEKYHNMISIYEAIPKNDFVRYSDIQNFEDLKNSRGKEILDFFTDKRISYLTK